jgi:hypothetical protein
MNACALSASDLRIVGQRGEPLRNGQEQQVDLGRIGVAVRSEDPERLQPVSDVGQCH